MPSSHDSANLELLRPGRPRSSGRRARPPGGRRLLRALLGLALVLGVLELTACNKLFGEFYVDSDPGPALCGAGTHRCVGAQLLECDSGQSWDETKVCLSEDRCNSGVGACLVCEAGMARCNLNWREVCAADESGWQAIEECPPGMCDPTCDCQHPETCQCVEGEFRCEAGDASNPEAQSNMLAKCMDGLWVVQDTCLNDGLCLTAVQTSMNEPESFTGQCPEPVCNAPGALNCTGSTLQRCSQQQDMWNSVGECATEEVCQLVATTTDPAAAFALTECPTICSPALSYRCEGQNVLQCSEDQTTEEPIATCPEGESCDVDTGGCRKCTTGELRCNVENLETCDSNYEWVLVEPCETRALCSVSTDTGTGAMQGECLEPACDVTDFACDGATLMHCNADRTQMVEDQVCGSSTLCNDTDGRCDEPVCETDGDVECTATNTLRRCVDGRSRWETIVECPVGSFCNADPTLGANCLTECPDPPVQCVGNVRRVCSDSTGVALWTVERTCSTPELCQCVLDNSCANLSSDELCGEPLCGQNLPDFQCDGATLQECNSGRDGWVTQASCGSEDLCRVDSDGDGGACLACPEAGEVQCYNSNTARHTCSSDQLQWVDSQTCSFGCIDNGTDDYCAACVAGELRCNGGDLDICASDRATLEDEQNCPYTCVNSGIADYCALCQAGESRCNGSTSLEECSEDLELEEVEDCAPYSCIDDGTDDFCGSCQDGAEQCNGNDLETCSGGVWGGGMECAHGCIGDPGGDDYCAPDCDPEDYDPTCSDDDERVTCSDEGEFVATACSGATDECIGAGRCVACDPEDYDPSCSGDSRLTCSAAGSVQSTPCTGTTPQCIGDGVCAACDPATPAACVSDTLRICEDDGTWVETDCTDDGQQCTVISTVAACRDCDVGTIACASSTSEHECLADGTWDDPVTCPNGAACASGACEDCRDGDTQCDGEDLETCVNGAWDAEPCEFGCGGDFPTADCEEDPDPTTTSTTSTTGTAGTGGGTSTTGTGGVGGVGGMGGVAGAGTGGVGGAATGGAAGGG